MEEFDNLIIRNTTFLDNPYVSATITVFLIVYAGAIAPKLPARIVKMFDNVIAKMFMFFLIVFLSRRNATVAIIASIAMMVTVMALNKIKFEEEMMDVVGPQEQKKIKLGSCECTCDSFEEIKPKTDDGKLVVAEAKAAVTAGALSEEKAKEIAKDVVVAEIKGDPVLVAKTEEGAKRMEEIAKLVNNGDMHPEEAKQKVAVIVISEAVVAERAAAMNSTQPIVQPISQPKVETTSVAPSVTETASQASKSSSLEEMASEVLRRKDEEMSKNGGVEPSDAELRKLCANVVDDFKRCSLGCNKGNTCVKAGNMTSQEIPTIPSTYPMFADDMTDGDSSYSSQYANIPKSV